jgi:hypothetical protein
MRGKVVGLVAAVALFASVGIANAKSPRSPVREKA